MHVPLGDFVAHAQVAGPDAPWAAPVLLLHSLGTTLHLWDPQLAALAKHHRVVRMDLRGHGLSEAPHGDYSMTQLATDAFALLDTLGIDSAHVGGVSIGGRIALEMAATRPERVRSLIACDTALEFGPPETWQQRMDAVRAGGLAAVAEGVMARWVCDTSLASSRGLRRMLLGTDPAGYLGCAAALRECRADPLHGRIACPTTVIVGDRDASTPPAAAAAIRDAIPGARLVTIPEAAHLPNHERAAAVTAAVLAHLAHATALPPTPAEAGFAIREVVLGRDYVAAAEAAVTPFTAPFRQFILDGVWGGVWTRPGLTPRDRSLLCLGILASLGHEAELKIHVRATRNTGVTRDEIAEVLVQVAAYAGVPAANAAFRAAKDVFEQEGPA